MNLAISLALLPLYMLLIGLLARFILRRIPDGKIKRLLSRRVGP
jgi:hypothetical protein